VDLKKGPFLGREALAKINEEGPQWKLCTFTLNHDGPKLMQGGEAIIRREKVVGVVSSGGYGHTIGKSIAMGYLSASQAKEADGYSIEVYQERIPVTRHLQALYDPKRMRILA